jgi:polyisoprenoid-binding protein YceI
MSVEMIGRRTIFVALATLAISACSPGEPETAFASSSTPAINGERNAVTPASVNGAALRLVLASTGNAARYRVRERLMGHDFDNDAIGETKNLTGAIAFDSNGKVIGEGSKFTVDAGTFVSDKNRRDGFVRGRLLEADQFPTVMLVPTSVRGMTIPLPKTGSRPFEMTGDLTVRGVTRPTAWNGTVQFKDGAVSGSAATAFTFNDIQMEQPRVPVLLSVADTIRLEIDFNLVQQR